MNTLCRIREIYRSIIELEERFEKEYNLCFNEGVLLCKLSEVKVLSSGEIAEALGLTTSNTSKVIKSAEGKGFIKRMMGDKDKRQMYFSLTPEGEKMLGSISCSTVKVPELLRPLLEPAGGA